MTRNRRSEAIIGKFTTSARETRQSINARRDVPSWRAYQRLQKKAGGANTRASFPVARMAIRSHSPISSTTRALCRGAIEIEAKRQTTRVSSTRTRPGIPPRVGASTSLHPLD